MNNIHKKPMMHKTSCTHVFLSRRVTDVGSKESLKQMFFFPDFFMT